MVHLLPLCKFEILPKKNSLFLRVVVWYLHDPVTMQIISQGHVNIIQQLSKVRNFFLVKFQIYIVGGGEPSLKISAP